jgi:hypothetical protein
VVGRLQLGEQRRQGLGPALPPAGRGRPSGGGDADHHHPPVGRIGAPYRQAVPFEAGDQLGHRGLADALRTEQLTEPMRAGPVQATQRRGGGQAQLLARREPAEHFGEPFESGRDPGVVFRDVGHRLHACCISPAYV